MGLTPTEVLAFPKIQAIVRDNGTADVIVAGNSRAVARAGSLQQLRENALALVVGEAKTLNRAVRVAIDDPEGHGELIVSPDGSTESVSYTPKPVRRRIREAATTTAPRVAVVTQTAPVAPAQSHTAPAPAQSGLNSEAAALTGTTAPTGTTMPPSPETVTAAAPAVEDAPARRSLKETSFLVSAPVLEPATQGWRGTLTRLGLRMDPSEEELSERKDVRTVSQHW